ncbi:Scr1 family TA system antitoxin-like transcriptional regulator [Streptomyces acidicola]|uniref:Scr1 family TA system antitoxin-like transcriptional regulator n=1 Tax=Streptomyces acidicola TaxID=2596892 RepID=UPI00381FC657
MVSLSAAEKNRGANSANRVARRTARAQFMGHEGRTYHTLLGEQALRTNFGGAEVMRGQLAHLLEALELPGLRLGIIPSRAELALFPGHAFSIFDDRQVKIETYSAGLNITDEAEVTAYRKAFAWLARSAVYGEAARRLIEEELRAVS